MTEAIIPLILCGGAGTRLWPASREGRPKQFLRLFGPYSTFQDTLKRVSDWTVFGRPVVITNTQSRFLVLEQLEEIGIQADILLEPLRRDSAPAIAAATIFAQRERDDPIVFTLAADHVVTDPAAFAAACGTARAIAQAGRIVTFGIRPDRPATEYGYICPGDPLGDGVFAVRQFVEKPDEQTARRYVEEGFLWNSGNFMFHASAFLAEYRTFEPDSAAAVSAAVEGAGKDLGFVTLAAGSFERATAKSVDYAVMERTSLAAVVPVSFGWSDVGSWDAVWALKSKDPNGNVSQGSVVFVDTRQSLVSSEKALVAVLGVDDLAVVASTDAILVARRSDAQAMKGLVSRLRDIAPAITEEHVVVHRPWGSYQSLEVGNRYQVKRIIVKTGKRLSLQMHHHRAEHWVVVRGTARVTVGDEIKILHENESTYVPTGAMHRLENPGKIDLELIEIQTGTYLGEDDIVRFEDDFRRS
jgi:mannose-1-phosphate guanylyltransferase/mannose-6-phosphate isomerase